MYLERKNFEDIKSCIKGKKRFIHVQENLVSDFWDNLYPTSGNSPCRVTDNRPCACIQRNFRDKRQSRDINRRDNCEGERERERDGWVHWEKARKPIADTCSPDRHHLFGLFSNGRRVHETYRDVAKRHTTVNRTRLIST